MIALSRIKMDNNKYEMTTVTLNVKRTGDKAVASKTHLFSYNNQLAGSNSDKYV